eukprot:scaffold181105_cov33-Tisochrysis_lutea.AAC.3
MSERTADPSSPSSGIQPIRNLASMDGPLPNAGPPCMVHPSSQHLPAPPLPSLLSQSAMNRVARHGVARRPAILGKGCTKKK